jgi:DNA repair protein RadC
VSLRVREEIQEMPRGDGVAATGIRAIAPRDRPRERLHRIGAEQLRTDELLAIVLGSGCRGVSAVELGRRVLSRVEHSLKALATRPVGDLRAETGIGIVRAVRIHAALELGRRAVVERPDDRRSMQTVQDVLECVGADLRSRPVEELHVLLLDSQNRLQRKVFVTRGTLDATTVHAREVFREAIVDAAAAVILVHNHPGGDSMPSDEDIAVTERIVRVGRDLGIPVLDHIIVGRASHASVLERPWA